MTARDVGRRSRLDARRRDMRRFYLLTGSSTVVPGAGLFGTRRRWVGAAVLGVFVLAALVAVVKLGTQGVLRTALNVGVDRDKLLVVIVAILAAALIWCAAIVLTSVLSRPEEPTRNELLTTRVFAALCCCLVIFPALIAARAVSIQRGVVSTVFTGGSDPMSTAGVTPDAAKEDPWAKIPRVNILLLGSDAGPDRTGIRTDSMIVASVNTHTGDAVLFGLPRNLENVPFPKDNPLHEIYPDGYNCGDQCLLNGVWTLAESRPDLFPGNKHPGLTVTRDVIGETLGLKINQTVVIDLKGFQQLVDAMGGVDINVKDRLCINCHVVNGQVVGTTGWIEPGRQHLNGFQALWYARSRAQSDDFNRMRRQRCVVGALISQVNPVKMLSSYGSLATVLKQNVSIDIPQSDLPAWVTLVERMQDGTIRSLPITDQVVNVTRPDFTRIRALVAEATKAPSAKTPPATQAGTPTPSTTTTTPRTPGGATSTTTTPSDELTTLSATC